MNEWTWGVDTPCWNKPRRTIYFIYRRKLDGSTEYLNDRAGRLREWRSRDSVKLALERLQ
jgi:hypothetical protein